MNDVHERNEGIGGNGNCVRIMRSAYVLTCRGRFQAFPANPAATGIFHRGTPVRAWVSLNTWTHVVV